VWPAPWLSSRTGYYWLTLAITCGAIALLWRIVFAPFGYALRAARDSPLRAAAIGIDVRTVRWAGFVLAGLAAGLAGSLYAFSKGSISPESLSIPRSVDALVMVLLGGLQTMFGPVVGAALLAWLQDMLARHTEYWRAMLGAAVLVLVLVFPRGIVGAMVAAGRALRQRGVGAPAIEA
jgi:branched-chain amino acid transport system permease protein